MLRSYTHAPKRTPMVVVIDPGHGGKDGGAADAIEHEKTGLICDGNNLDDVYSSINSILENKKYLEYGKYAKEFATKFEWTTIIKDYKKILN